MGAELSIRFCPKLSPTISEAIPGFGGICKIGIPTSRIDATISLYRDVAVVVFPYAVSMLHHATESLTMARTLV